MEIYGNVVAYHYGQAYTPMHPMLHRESYGFSLPFLGRNKSKKRARKPNSSQVRGRKKKSSDDEKKYSDAKKVYENWKNNKEKEKNIPLLKAAIGAVVTDLSPYRSNYSQKQQNKIKTWVQNLSLAQEAAEKDRKAKNQQEFKEGFMEVWRLVEKGKNNEALTLIRKLLTLTGGETDFYVNLKNLRDNLEKKQKNQ